MANDITFVCPIPPSSNKLYSAVAQVGATGKMYASIIKTTEARKYEASFVNAVLEDERNIDLLRLREDTFTIDSDLVVDATFYLKRLRKKDPGPKRRAEWTSVFLREDVANFIKLFADCLATLLGIDDCIILKWIIEKKEDASDPRVVVTIHDRKEGHEYGEEVPESERFDPHRSFERLADLVRGNLG